MAAKNWLIAVVPAILLAAFALEASAGGKTDRTSASKVKATVDATKPAADGKQLVTITLDIERGWYLYANPTDCKKVELSATLVTLKAKDKLTALVQYPAGRVKVDGRDTFKIYQDRVSIPVQVQRTVGDASPLEITVSVNACNGSACLFPGAIRLTVP